MGVLGFVTLLNALAPALAQLAVNYKKIIEAGEVTTEDIEAAKELFEGTRLKEWDEL